MTWFYRNAFEDEPPDLPACCTTCTRKPQNMYQLSQMDPRDVIVISITYICSGDQL